VPANGAKVPLKVCFDELGVHRRAALGLLPNVEDPELNDRMQFSRYKSSRQYKFIDNLTVTLSGGSRLCRTTRPLSLPGRIYWEADYRSSVRDGHVQLGFAMIRVDMEAPVGVDAEGYSVRDLGGARRITSRSKSSAIEG
jgi:hypothetical protein